MNRIFRVAGVVLAAGSSSRMGRPKQLLPFRGQSVLECVLDIVVQTSLDQVVVVLGCQAENLASKIGQREVRLVFNPHYEKGQSTSIQVGLEAVASEVDAVMFFLADQPLIAPETVDTLLCAYRGNPCPIVYPLYNGTRGNPVLFDCRTFPGIEGLSGDTGARVLFTQFADGILQLPVDDPGILFDIDTEQDYRALRKIEKGEGCTGVQPQRKEDRFS